MKSAAQQGAGGEHKACIKHFLQTLSHISQNPMHLTHPYILTYTLPLTYNPPPLHHLPSLPPPMMTDYFASRTMTATMIAGKFFKGRQPPYAH